MASHWYPSATCLILDSQLNIGIGLNFLQLQGSNSSKHSLSSLSSFDAHYQGTLGAPGSATAAVQWICFEHMYQENAPTHPKDLASYTWRRAAPSHIYSGARGKEHPKILLWWKVGKMMENEQMHGSWQNTNIKMLQKRSKIQKDKVETPKTSLSPYIKSKIMPHTDGRTIV